VFSHDRRWHDESASIAAIRTHRIGCFYLWGAQMPTWDKLRGFTRGYDHIRQATDVVRPFIFYLNQFGALTRVPIP
jgi:hypothetical protein